MLYYTQWTSLYLSSAYSFYVTRPRKENDWAWFKVGMIVGSEAERHGGDHGYIRYKNENFSRTILYFHKNLKKSEKSV